ncbi:MAG: CvpA family protein [Saprospiraceae bacterium]|nr:CvpA family protein [Saprospiraceae bacterium]
MKILFIMIDLFFFITAGYGFFLGFYRGIIQTIFTILSYVFGLLAAFKLSPAATKFLETATGSDHPLMFVAGFLIAFFWYHVSHPLYFQSNF